MLDYQLCGSGCGRILKRCSCDVIVEKHSKGAVTLNKVSAEVSVRNRRHKKTLAMQGFSIKSGGEGEIRTLDTISRIHAFQASSFSHSDTSPQLLIKLLAYSMGATLSEQVR